MITYDYVQLSELTTFKQAGRLKTLVIAETLADLTAIVRDHPDFYVLGKGSKLLINPDSDRHFFIKLSRAFQPVAVHNQQFHVSAGTPSATLLTLMKHHSLSGLEFLAGVPVTVGGIITMNFGCHGHSISQFVKQVHVLTDTGEERWLSGEELHFSYRHSLFQEQHWIILDAVFSLTPDRPETIQHRIKDYIQKRKISQPFRAHSFGSIFKNPAGHSAGQLIDAAGFRGYRHGSVQISEIHANFMVNCGNGSFQEAVDLIHMVQNAVQERYNILLEPEVRLIG